MSPRARAPDREWRAPSDDELVVLRAQILEAIADGERLLGEPFDDGRWAGWETGLTHLIELALGPGRWPDEFRYARGSSPRMVVDVDAYDGFEVRAEELQRRNDDVRAKLGVAREALRAVDQDMTRRGARPVEGATLPAEAFTFVASEQLRAIAQRDYDEIRAAARTVKARALLAGSVIEAVLMDALVRNGFALEHMVEMRFHALIKEAAAAKIVSDRTAKVADSLRDMRNLVHPAVELKDGRLRAADADAALSLMRLVLEDLR